MLKLSSLVVLGVLAIGGPLDAQKVRLEVLLPPQPAWAAEAPAVSSAGLLSDPSMRDLLANGFPARLHYRLERWVSGRWFDDLKAAFEWDVILKYDVLGKKYQVVRVVNKKAESLGDYPAVADADDAVEAAYKVGDTAAEKGAARVLQPAAGRGDAVAERSRRGAAVAEGRAQAGGEREEESGDSGGSGGADARSAVTWRGKEALRGQDGDIQALTLRGSST